MVIVDVYGAATREWFARYVYSMEDALRFAEHEMRQGNVVSCVSFDPKEAVIEYLPFENRVMGSA